MNKYRVIIDYAGGHRLEVNKKELLITDYELQQFMEYSNNLFSEDKMRTDIKLNKLNRFIDNLI